MKALMMILVAGMMTGCGMIEAIDAKLRTAGVLPGASLENAGMDARSVVAIEADGEQGVGVVVDDGLVFTAYHVVRSAAVIRVKFFGHYRDRYYKEVEGRVVYRNAGLDQCLVRVDTQTPHCTPMGAVEGGEAYCITLGSRRTNRFGRTVAYPSLRTVSVDPHRYHARLATRPGDSGSPIIQGGRVVGLVRGPSWMVPTRLLGGRAAVLARSKKDEESRS